MPERIDLVANIHVMKTGGQTMCDILRQSFPGRHCDLQVKGVATADDLRFARRFYPSLRSIAGHNVVPLSNLGEACDSIRFFAFLRDPVERCISHYQYRRNKDETSDFEPWLERFANYQVRFLSRTHTAADPWAIAPSADLAIEAVEQHVGFIGLQERFDESLVMLRRWVDDPRFDIEYRARNVAPKSSVRRQLLGDPRIDSFEPTTSRTRSSTATSGRRSIRGRSQRTGPGSRRTWRICARGFRRRSAASSRAHSRA